MKQRSSFLVAVVATLAMSVSYLDRQALAVIAPTVRESLGISHAMFGWLGSAFALAYLVFSPLSGRVVDRIGPKRALAGAVVAWSVVSAAHSLAGGFFSLVVLRALLGALESPSFPSAARTIRTALPEGRRSAAMGLLFTGSSFGAMVAAPLASKIAHRYGFRTAFVVTAAVGLAWLPLWLLVAPSDAETTTAPSPFAPPPRPWTTVLLDRAFVRQAFVVLGSAPAILVVLQWFPQFLTEACGVARADVGHYLWLPPLVFDAFAVGFGLAGSHLDRKRPHPAAAHHGLVAVAAALTTLLVAVPFVPGTWAKVVLGSLSMAGGAGMYVVGTADLLRRIDPRDAALAGGLSAAVQSAVHIVANPLFGFVVDRTHLWGPVMAAGTLALPCALAWSVLLERAPPARPAPP